MSASVWFEEINTGLLQELKDTIMIRNANGVLVPLENEAHSFVVRKPEEDFKFEKYPCVSIYNTSYKFDPQRYDPNLVVSSIDTENDTMVLEDPHVAFNLTYQIDFWARYQTDMDAMTQSWLMSHFRQFNVSVVDDGGNTRSCNCMQQGDVVKSDLVESNERLYHSVITLLIWVELDSGMTYNKPMVGVVNIDATQND